MGLTQTLATSLSGLTATQTGLSIVAGNVANADTPGYVRKTLVQVPIGSGDAGIGVRVSAIQRTLDQYVQKQLRVENSGASYADLRAQFYSRLQSIYGDPGSASSLESVYNGFTNALQALSASPDDSAARSAVIGAAQQLAQSLNATSDGIQALRGAAEFGISDAVSKANEAMSQIAKLNQQIATLGDNSTASAAMLDQRDSYIDQLSQLMDINVIKTGNGVSIYTNSGVQLVGSQAAQISFDPSGTVSATSRWSADPTERSLGTLVLNSPNGGSVDLIQSNAIRSGSIAAYLQMRDHDLVQAQNQLDGIAAAMASALSDTTTAGSPVAGGFQVDVGSLSAGNTVTVNYTDTATSTPHTITLVRVDDPSLLPLSNDATAAAGDTVYGIDFSGGMAAAIAQINAAIGSAGLVASNPSGTLLRVVDDGTSTATVNAVSATTTATALTGGTALPFFTDGGGFYTGAITALGSQSVGFASRIAVNAALVADPSKLVLYQAGTAAGDSTRPDFIYRQLTSASLTFSPDGGIGSANAPFTGSIGNYLRQALSQQGEAASAADNLKQGQDVVLSNLQQRFNEQAAVNIDQEMANLLNLQNAYAANARVLSTVADMLATLLKM